MKTTTLKSVMAVLGVLLSLNAFAYDVEIDGIYYNVTKKMKIAEVTSGDSRYSGEVTIPESFEYDGDIYSVTSISDDAFNNCGQLTSINIPNSVTSIGNGAFFACFDLTSITIPNSVTYIDNYAFSRCSGLTSINIPNSVTSIGDGTFSGCSGLTSINIPNSVTSIGSEAFRNCSGLNSITIPNSVTSIDVRAFQGCSGLSSVTIPNSVTSIGDGTFSGCSGLTSITIPNSVTSIDGLAFNGCSKLTSVEIGSGIQSIGNNAFASCGELLDFSCAAETPPSLGTDVFKDSYIEYVTLHVPEASVYAYQAADGWGDFQSVVVLEASEEEPEDVTLTEDVDMYFNGTERTCNSISYTRTFNNTEWQALYVPFSLTYDDWKEDFEVARINAFYEYDTDEDGTVDEVDLEIIKVKEGNGDLRPNYPYLIKAKETGEKTLTPTDATLYVTVEDSYDCATMDTKYTFTGTYQKMNGMKTAGYYFMSGGSLKTASNDEVTLGAFRWYMKAESRGSAFLERPANINIRVVGEVDDNEATSIEGIETTDSKADSNRVYSMDGRLVSTNGLQGLKAGIYLMNGKKVWVK